MSGYEIPDRLTIGIDKAGGYIAYTRPGPASRIAPRDDIELIEYVRADVATEEEPPERVRAAPPPPELTEWDEKTEELAEQRADPDLWPMLRRTDDLPWGD